MSKQLHNVYATPAAVGATFAALSGEGWPAEKARVLRDGSVLVSRTEQPDGSVVIVSSRNLPKGIPGFLERFLPRDGKVLQTDTWQADPADGTRSGTWLADMPGAPAKVGGTMRLEPVSGGSTYVVDGTVTVKIPIVGGKAESLIADMTSKLTAKEAEVLVAMLS